MLLTVNKGGKVYASRAQRKYAAKMRKNLATERKGEKMEEDAPGNAKKVVDWNKPNLGPAEEEEFCRRLWEFF